MGKKLGKNVTAKVDMEPIFFSFYSNCRLVAHQVRKDSQFRFISRDYELKQRLTDLDSYLPQVKSSTTYVHFLEVISFK